MRTGITDNIDTLTGKIIHKNNGIPQPNYHWGDGEVRNLQTYANLRMPLNATGSTELYAFGGFSNHFGTGNGFWRYLDGNRNWQQVGAEQTIVRGRASIGATYFNQRFRDMIQYNGFVDEGTPNYYNLAAATSRGVEVTLHVSPVAPLTLAASYTYTKTRVTNAGSTARPPPASSRGSGCSGAQRISRARPRHALPAPRDVAASSRSRRSAIATIAISRMRSPSFRRP